MNESPKAKLGLEIGRWIFGVDPRGYAAVRPEYPDALYVCLKERCGLKSGCAVFEVGPGAGLATAALLAHGANPLYGIEPDPQLANFLRNTLAGEGLSIYDGAFEDVDLDPASFDLGVSATAFHWLEQASALSKARRLLRPGGWWAMWWTHFGSANGADPFLSATHHLFSETPDSPSQGVMGSPPFALDAKRRLDDLGRAGFVDAGSDRWLQSATFSTKEIVRLYSTYSTIQVLQPSHRTRLLHQLAEIAERRFGGVIILPLVTQLYTARNPPA